MQTSTQTVKSNFQARAVTARGARRAVPVIRCQQNPAAAIKEAAKGAALAAATLGLVMGSGSPALAFGNAPSADDVQNAAGQAANKVKSALPDAPDLGDAKNIVNKAGNAIKNNVPTARDVKNAAGNLGGNNNLPDANDAMDAAKGVKGAIKNLGKNAPGASDVKNAASKAGNAIKSNIPNAPDATDVGNALDRAGNAVENAVRSSPLEGRGTVDGVKNSSPTRTEYERGVKNYRFNTSFGGAAQPGVQSSVVDRPQERPEATPLRFLPNLPKGPDADTPMLPELAKPATPFPDAKSAPPAPASQVPKPTAITPNPQILDPALNNDGAASFPPQ